jgi:hypothetical protein
MKRPEPYKLNLREDKYRKTDKHPSHKGVVDIDGKFYWVSGWYNEGEYGSYFKGELKAVTDDEMAKYFTEEDNTVVEQRIKKSTKKVFVDDNESDELPF